MARIARVGAQIVNASVELAAGVPVSVRQQGPSLRRVKPNSCLPPRRQNPRAGPLSCRLPLKGGVIEGPGAGFAGMTIGRQAGMTGAIAMRRGVGMAAYGGIEPLQNA